MPQRGARLPKPKDAQAFRIFMIEKTAAVFPSGTGESGGEKDHGGLIGKGGEGNGGVGGAGGG